MDDSVDVNVIIYHVFAYTCRGIKEQVVNLSTYLTIFHADCGNISFMININFSRVRGKEMKVSNA